VIINTGFGNAASDAEKAKASTSLKDAVVSGLGRSRKMEISNDEFNAKVEQAVASGKSYQEAVRGLRLRYYVREKPRELLPTPPLLIRPPTPADALDDGADTGAPPAPAAEQPFYKQRVVYVGAAVVAAAALFFGRRRR